jgi:hypothetical protein
MSTLNNININSSDELSVSKRKETKESEYYINIQTDSEIPESIKICYMKMLFILKVEDGCKVNFKTQSYTSINSILGSILRYSTSENRDGLITEISSIYRLLTEILVIYKDKPLYTSIVTEILGSFCMKLEHIKQIYKNDMKVSSSLDIYIHQFRSILK